MSTRAGCGSGFKIAKVVERSLSTRSRAKIQPRANRPRPSAELVHVIRHTGSGSYPSGHVAFFSWFLILLVLCLAVGRLPKPIVVALWIIAAFLLAAVCIGRVYMGEHWPSDVLGGLSLGMGWTALALSVRVLSNPVLERKR